MTYTVYALRLNGCCELRYIGLTSGDPTARISNLRSCETGIPGATPFGWWLTDHSEEIEAITLAKFATREQGKSAEIAAIATALAAGQRLFNRDHVPKHLQTPRTMTRREIAA